MTIQEWLGIILTSLSIITAFGVGVRWIIRHYLKDVLHELKPNSGSSIKDQVTRLEKEMQSAENTRRDMNAKIDHMYDVLLTYIAGNSSK